MECRRNFFGVFPFWEIMCFRTRTMSFGDGLGCHRIFVLCENETGVGLVATRVSCYATKFSCCISIYKTALGWGVVGMMLHVSFATPQDLHIAFDAMLHDLHFNVMLCYRIFILHWDATLHDLHIVHWCNTAWISLEMDATLHDLLLKLMLCYRIFILHWDATLHDLHIVHWCNTAWISLEMDATLHEFHLKWMLRYMIFFWNRCYSTRSSIKQNLGRQNVLGKNGPEQMHADALSAKFNCFTPGMEPVLKALTAYRKTRVNTLGHAPGMFLDVKQVRQWLWHWRKKAARRAVTPNRGVVW